MKLIFLDADGTLFHHEGYIPDSAIKACIQAQKNGNKVILCTGRQRIEIFGPMLEIDYDAIIAGSGATIECEHKIVEENALTKEESQYLSNYLLTNHIPANFESSTGIYATQYTKDTMLKMVEEQCAGKTEEEKAKGAQGVQQRMCSRHRNNHEKQQSDIVQDGNQLVPPDPLAKAGNGAQKPLKLAAPLQVQDQIVHIFVPIGFINLGTFQNDLRQPAVHQLHTRQAAGSHHIDQHAHRVNIRFGSGLVKAELLRCGKALGA